MYFLVVLYLPCFSELHLITRSSIDKHQCWIKEANEVRKRSLRTVGHTAKGLTGGHTFRNINCRLKSQYHHVTLMKVKGIFQNMPSKENVKIHLLTNLLQPNRGKLLSRYGS